MSDSKHTPGPWVNDGGAFYPAWALDEDGYNRKGYIAEMLNGYDESYDANAALIAAAPEMLVALEAVVAIAKEAHAHWDADRHSRVGKILLALAGANEAYDNRIDWIHAAIAKAKGEQL